MASVKQRADGSWRARYRDAADTEHARHFATRRAAQAWLDEVTSSMVTGRWVDPIASSITLQQYYDDWSTRQIWASGTVTAMNLAMRTCTFGELELNRLSRSHIEGWIKAMSVQGLAPGTIKTRVNNVRGVIRAAVRDRRLPEDPSAGVKLPRVRKIDSAMRIPTPAEVAALLDAAPSWFAPYIALCAFAGLRLGEASALQSGDIDFLRRKIHVRRQVQRVAAREVSITAPKYGSERAIDAPDELLAMLTEHLRTTTPLGAARWLFDGQYGEPPHQNTVGYWWRLAKRDANVEGIRLHDLRHFYASGLIASGLDVVTVQRSLGHARATTTLNTYSHLWPTAEERTRSAASELMRSVLASSPATATGL
ncbi:site-specific integrase [uncultured Microbacterium sp.]|uniref:Phage integrase family protein n=1 Tax=uncultured Microbacterium sp. TaxID=191216 RepID=A0A1Y5NUU3_9MICO|nr:site-specific integrase [uncultured Microbacterium sp.]SBS70187.1 Phage integrase family protein [uncultured Microbacterium sp.]